MNRPTVDRVMAEVHHLGPGVDVPASELAWRFSAAGGPGGQHVNTSNTRVELLWDVAASPGLPDDVRRRLVSRLGPTVRVVASDRRSQAQNRQLALERLAERVAAGLHQPATRRPTRPTLSSQRRRLDAKRRQGDRKRERRGRWDDA
ncbi:MAG TPA: alternative ribosome rescue aminoacyl-tRNA hydrolase ArfB [Acidimicrobiales bacterium]|nr:alternative ribosome rescue aminoacyl-tRNA hydrolase ArfB [Acidimicrobiales bacterium]